MIMKKIKYSAVIPFIILTVFPGCKLDRLNQYDPSSPAYLADTELPVVKSFSISPGSEDVELDAGLTVVFSEPMDTSSVESAFTLAGESDVSGSFEWTDDSETVTFTPSCIFGLYGTYTATLGSPAKDIHGNAINTETCTFTTRGPLGSLDSSFGTGGYVAFDDPSLHVEGNAAVLDSEGRILVAGKYGDDMCIWRYNTDGTLDTSFNNQGYATDDSAAAADDLYEAYGITLDSSGRIFVTGYSEDTSGYSDMTVWRYTSEGVPYGFSGQGNDPVTFNAGRSYADDEGRAIVVDDEGNIYVAGTSVDTSDYPVMALWCYNSDGSPKTSFGNNGIIATSEADTSEDITYARAADIALDSQGRIVIAGHYLFEVPNTGSHIVVRRYNSDGTADSTFSGDGWWTSHGIVGGDYLDAAWGLFIDDNDDIYITGSIDRYSLSKDEDLIVMKIKENGDLDLNFNNSGYITVGNADGLSGNNNGLDIKIDGSGKILVAGLSHYYGDNPDTRLSILRFNPDGSLDTGFNNQGWVIFGSMGTINPYNFRAELIFDTDNKIVVAGTDTYNMTIWKYE